MGEDYEIFGKIRVADILIPKKSHPADVKDESADPVAGRHFDFVLCDKATLAVSCVVQLYDKALASRQPEPDPLQAICENLGLPYARFQIKADYSVEEIRGKLLKALVKEPAYLIETDGRKEPRISSLDDIEI